MSTGWNVTCTNCKKSPIINLLGNEYWLEPVANKPAFSPDYKPTGK